MTVSTRNDTNEPLDIDVNTTAAENKTKNEEVDYDELLSSAGEFGPYQILLFFSTFPFYVFGVFAYYTQIFMTDVSPNHWCWIPELQNLTSYQRRSLAIPPDIEMHFGYSQCRAYVANWTDVIITGNVPNETWDTVPCQHGWEFNKSEIPYPTISSELGWVCDKNSYQATAQAIFFIGSIAGGFIVGWIADRYGRIPAIVSSNLLGCIGGTASMFATNFVVFSTCRFITGMSYDNCMMMAYLIVLEYVAPKYRSYVSNMAFALFYGSAVTVLPWIVLLCGHWKTIALATSLPLVLAILAPFFIPESPRWLLSKGRIDDAIKKVLAIGRINKKEVPQKLIEQFKNSTKKKTNERNESSLEMLKKPLLRRMFICICVEYMCCTIVFDGLVRSLKQLEFDYFLTFSLVSFTEIPSMILTAFVMDWMGRRWLSSIVMFISFIFSILTVSTSGVTSVIFAIIARFAVNISYSAAMQWAAEMMPVSVRGSGASIVHICGYVATVISPYVIYLETYIYWLPLVVIGCIAGFGGIIALALPETARKDMPQTFEDAEDLVRSLRFWEVPFLSKKNNSEGNVNESFEM
ncbi:carcinine transporter-like [Achroia grisella]|uniref:carcinine transporter-like n=1 Tax=Achroia grisella TaxID=688607 RepID=UPI0027D2C527|nr:carcinine transporter-like [Achroia grisella]